MFRDSLPLGRLFDASPRVLVIATRSSSRTEAGISSPDYILPTGVWWGKLFMDGSMGGSRGILPAAGFEIIRTHIDTYWQDICKTFRSIEAGLSLQHV